MPYKEDHIKVYKKVSKSGKHILFSFLIVLCGFSRANDIPWEYQESTNFDYIEIVLEKFPMDINDAIGVFGTNPETLESNCLGYLIWDGQTRVVKAYGFDGNLGNYVAGNYTLKLWKDLNKCVIDLDYVTVSGSSNFIGNGFVSKLKITTPLTVFVDATYALFTISNETCDHPGQIRYIQNTVIGKYAPYDFTLYDGNGEKIATNNTGLYRGLEAGTYTFEAKDTKGCLSTKEVFVDSTILDIANIYLETTDDVCDKGGSIFIDTTTIVEGKAPYRFILENEFSGDGKASTKNTIEGIEDGNYQLIIIDQNTCTDTVYVSVLEDDLDCNRNNILAPLSSDPSANQISFDCSQNIKVIDELGRLIKVIGADGSWNGADAGGNLVPNGTYFIYCNEHYLRSIEVLK